MSQGGEISFAGVVGANEDGYENFADATVVP